MTDKNKQLSETANLLLTKVLLDHTKPVDVVFGAGVSDDMMAFFIKVAQNVTETFLSKFPEINDTLTINELNGFKALLNEAIGVGYRIYYAEKIYVKKDDHFSKHSGPKFIEYLNKEFNDYFVNESKNPDEITPSYIVEVSKQLAFTLFNEGIVKNGLTNKKLPQEFIDSSLMQPLWLILMGYTLSVLQEKY